MVGREKFFWPGFGSCWCEVAGRRLILVQVFGSDERIFQGLDYAGGLEFGVYQA